MKSQQSRPPLLLLWPLMVASSVASAQAAVTDESNVADARADLLFDRALRAIKEKQCSVAVDNAERAYRESPRPEMLLLRAKAHQCFAENIGCGDEANTTVGLLKSFLNEVKARKADYSEEEWNRLTTELTPPARRLAQYWEQQCAPRPRLPRILVGGGLVVAAAGAALLAVGGYKFAHPPQAPTDAEGEYCRVVGFAAGCDSFGTAPTMMVAGSIMVGLGAAAAIAGATLLATQTREAPRLGVLVTPTGAEFAVSGTF